jgi:hypothetical protein
VITSTRSSTHLPHPMRDQPEGMFKHLIFTWNARHPISFLSLSPMETFLNSESLCMTQPRSRLLDHGCPYSASRFAKQCASTSGDSEFLEATSYYQKYGNMHICLLVGCGICNPHVAPDSLDSRWSPGSPVSPVSRISPLSLSLQSTLHSENVRIRQFDNK